MKSIDQVTDAPVSADGDLDYRRFIILSRGRSGSNFLRGLLNSHSSIITFGELFRFNDSIGWEFPFHDRHLQAPDLTRRSQADPAGFLQEKVFRKYPEHISAVGFKLFYYHAREGSRTTVWSFVKDQKAMRIIHLKRNSTLKMILSEKKAFLTNSWTNTTGAEEKEFPIPLDYEECLQRFTREQAFKEQGDIYFADHPKIDVAYEDLASDYRNQMERVQAFLGVDYQDVRPSTHKQSNQPLSKAISNYFELKERFEHTPWEKFFED